MTWPEIINVSFIVKATGMALKCRTSFHVWMIFYSQILSLHDKEPYAVFKSQNLYRYCIKHHI